MVMSSGDEYMKMLTDHLKFNRNKDTINVKQMKTVNFWRPWKINQTETVVLLQQKYKGNGSESTPFIIDWIANDFEDPRSWSIFYKCFITLLISCATFGVTFISSAYIGSFDQIQNDFNASDELTILGLVLFVIAFAITPLFWAPFSEMFGRRPLLTITYGALTVFNGGTIASQNIWTILILRFFTGAFAACPLANSGAVLADLYHAPQRSIPLSLFAFTTFAGIILGPIIGGFVSENIGWRWVEGLMTIVTGVIWIFLCFLLPESYSPVLLHRRANYLSKLTGSLYRSKFEEKEKKKFHKLLKISLSRPWQLLFREPIVLLLSIYMAIIFGTLHMFFDAFPVVYQEKRGWNQGISQLPFLAIFVGVCLGTIYTILDNIRYKHLIKQSDNDHVPPESRLPPAMVGAISLPIALFWFAWTNSPSIHWIVSTLASVPFGFGMTCIFVSIFNYLIDAYTIYAASVLAANMVLRYIFGAVFPLFSTQMYHNLGIHWASCVPAFLTLICLPFPFLFYKFGGQIRKKCKYASEAEQIH